MDIRTSSGRSRPPRSPGIIIGTRNCRLRVVFWGTPEFATPPLRALIGEGFDVVGVVTQPDKPVGRSRSRPVPSAVKQVAIEEQIPVLQPERPRGEQFLAELRALAPDVSVVVAYGHLIPKSVLELPPLGSYNVHASLLPALRGAAPIQAAIIEGHRETGVTIMKIIPALDAGPIVLQARVPIPEDETYGELRLRLSELGALALIEAMTLVSLGEATEAAQDESLASYAGKIDRAAARIDWTRDAPSIGRVIRAYDPKPGAHSTLRGAGVKLFGARVVGIARGAPGEVLEISAEGLTVGCGDGAVRVFQVQPAGRKRMAPLDLERGRGVAVGDRLA